MSDFVSDRFCDDKEMAGHKFCVENEICGWCVQFLMDLLTQLRLSLSDNVQVLQSMSCLRGSECYRLCNHVYLILLKCLFTVSILSLALIFSGENFMICRGHKPLIRLTWAEIASYTDGTGEKSFQSLADLVITPYFTSF